MTTPIHSPLSTVIMNETVCTPVASSRECKVCGASPGSHHKHCKCGTQANGVGEISALFGWRKHHKLKDHVMPQSQCRGCRSNKSGSNSKPKVAAATTAVTAAVVSTPATTFDASSPDENPEEPWAPVETATKEGMHVKPIAATTAFAGDVTPLTFGPISIAPNALNTLEGSTMVPDIDEHFKMSMDEGVILANALRNAENTWVWGMSGTGKTSGIVQMCALLNKPLYRLNMSGDVSIDDLVGSTQVTIDAETGQAVTKFIYGRLIKAMLNGGVLLIDEITSAPPHVLMALQEVTEPCDNVHNVWASGKAHARYVCTANEGETIHAAPGFRVVVTDNTNGQGDVGGLFAGTNVMNEAFRSRFTQWFEKDFPSKLVWRQILTGKTGIDTAIASKIVEIAQEINKGSASLEAKNVTNNMIINPRDTLAIARHTKVYGSIAIAFKIGVINSMHRRDPDRVFLADTLKNIVGQ